MVAASILGGTAALILLQRRVFGWARLAAVVAVAAVVAGWGIAQYPWLLVDELTISDGAGAPATLRALLVVVGLAVVLVLPPLAYLYRLTQSQAWTGGPDHHE